MSALDVFQYSGQQVRTIIIDGEPWWIASDVSQVLGYSATSAMLRSLDDDEKGVQDLHTPGGTQALSIISESGLYSAIMRSQLPDAREFKRWITHDVLPQIRQTGGCNRDASGSTVEEPSSAGVLSGPDGEGAPGDLKPPGATI